MSRAVLRPDRELVCVTKRAGVLQVLRENPTWSSRRVAEAAGVGDDLVAAVRRSLTAMALVPEPGTSPDGS